MTRRSYTEYLSAVGIPTAILDYSRNFNQAALAALLGGHDQRGDVEHGLRGFILPWFGSLYFQAAADLFKKDTTKGDSRLGDIVVGMFAVIDLIAFLPSELMTQPATYHRPIQWDQIGSELIGLGLGVASEKIYRHFRGQRIQTTPGQNG